MRALVYTAPHRLELQTLETPRPAADEVLVRVRASGVCGSDVLGFLGKSKKRVPPLILGHELSGEIEAAGSAVKDLPPRARVAIMPLWTCGVCLPCRRGRNSVCERRVLLGMSRPGGFAEYVAVPRTCVYPVPAEVDFLTASMAEPLATPVNLFQNHVRGPLQSAAIFGAGTQGLVALQMARVSGATRLFIVDVHDARLQAARRLGATHALSAQGGDPVAAILAATDGAGCDVVVDAAGYSATRQQGLRVVARGGLLALIGLSDPSTELDILEIINREIEVHGVYGYSPRDYQRALDLIAAKRVDVSSWVKEFPLEEGPRLFERLTAQPGDLVKASLRP
jgi:threonine dehydrogenase-like Zn-dependent dehydrogenase